jgi:hypothetical protein
MKRKAKVHVLTNGKLKIRKAKLRAIPNLLECSKQAQRRFDRGARRGIDLAERHRLSVYDAMIGGAMHACGMRPRSFVNRAAYDTLRL